MIVFIFLHHSLWFARRLAGPGDNELFAYKSIQRDRTTQFVSKLSRL
jgi:hypothetical protein